MTTQSETLYLELLKHIGEIKEFTKNVQTHPTQFSFTNINHTCYEEMYLKKQTEIISKNEFYNPITDLKAECSRCWAFYLRQRNNSIRILDIQLGKKFQGVLTKYLNTKLSNGSMCVDADTENKKYPDLKIVKNGKNLAYLELKYQSAPFVFAFKQEGKKRECYEGSAALDLKKLKQQWELRESGQLKEPIYYVFWLDFPCVKGVFFMTLEEMWEYYNADAAVFKRKERTGDFTTTATGKKLTAEINKIHPSIYQMHSFEELAGILNNY